MTPISRRDVLAGLAASSAVSIVPVRGERAEKSPLRNAAFLSGEERRRRADALLRYFAGVAPDLLWAPTGLLKHPMIAQSQARQKILSGPLGLGHALDQPGIVSSCQPAAGRTAQAKALRACLRKSLELSRSCVAGGATSDHDAFR